MLCVVFCVNSQVIHRITTQNSNYFFQDQLHFMKCETSESVSDLNTQKYEYRQNVVLNESRIVLWKENCEGKNIRFRLDIPISTGSPGLKLVSVDFYESKNTEDEIKILYLDVDVTIRNPLGEFKGVLTIPNYFLSEKPFPKQGETVIALEYTDTKKNKKYNYIISLNFQDK